VIAIIARAAWSIGRTALRSLVGLGIAVAAVVGALVGLPEIALLLGLGLVSVVLAGGAAGLARLRARAGAFVAMMVPGSTGSGDGTGASGPAPMLLVAAIGTAVATPPAIFLEFLRIGAVLFGSGYLLVALLQAELVERLGWITEHQLVDAVAVGQATPGPLFSTATFVGYLVDGPVGAAAATVGIFLPAFVAVAISIPLLARLQRSVTFRAFLDGVNAAAVGLLAVAAYRLGVDVIDDVLAAAVAVVAFVLLWRGIGPVWLIVAGAAVAVVRALVVG
jgi:chromate transporter